MCGVIVVDAGRSRSTRHGRDAMFMIIALDVIIIMRFSINCLAVICSPTILFAILREASSETYGPGSLFHHISFRSTMVVSYLLPLQSFTFRSINQKYQKYLLYHLSISIKSYYCK